MSLPARSAKYFSSWSRRCTENMRITSRSPTLLVGGERQAVPRQHERGAPIPRFVVREPALAVAQQHVRPRLEQHLDCFFPVQHRGQMLPSPSPHDEMCQCQRTRAHAPPGATHQRRVAAHVKAVQVGPAFLRGEVLAHCHHVVQPHQPVQAITSSHGCGVRPPPVCVTEKWPRQLWLLCGGS
jgi:hypothetical protein